MKNFRRDKDEIYFEMDNNYAVNIQMAHEEIFYHFYVDIIKDCQIVYSEKFLGCSSTLKKAQKDMTRIKKEMQENANDKWINENTNYNFK